MGRGVGRVTFTEEEYARFHARLTHCLSMLGKVVTQSGFGQVPSTLGAELEVSLVGPDGRPVPVNAAVREGLGDDRLTLEVARFNLEANLEPVPVRGRPFTELAGQASRALTQITAWSLPHHGARAVPIGTLPTLTPADLTARALTDLPRYHALERAWARRRPTPFPLRAGEGEQGLFRAESVAVQGAACSWQVHLTVAPDLFCPTYNAAQLATGPALAAAGNSPFPLGRYGWQEARIPLYEQGFGEGGAPGRGTSRPRVGFGHAWLHGGPLAAFEEAVHRYDILLPATSPAEEDDGPLDGWPALEELRLHLSTVWPWNRPVYDPLGHVRIEFRALPSGPTPLDMAANTAFLVGLTLSLAAEGRDVARELPFAHARENFYRAARDGLRATLWWPSPGSAPREYEAGALVEELLPRAREGLVTAGVDAAEADTMLDLVDRRVASGRTGAWWQQRTLEVLRRRGRRAQHESRETTGPTATPPERGMIPPGRESTTGVRPDGQAERTGTTDARAVGTGRPDSGLRELTVRYARLAEGADPVHTWNLPTLPRRSRR
ncbi:glutamate--cysteine ligase [Streptomyces dangxiongensis]|uniref:Glutamate--cysteine ligase n=1 Tax=Streptomyces dangxiongensis TaxID=1442032 RepID=A0A3G2JAJ4_9ACTN|nr:glutamate--cysteine ligase [Streptomyces dangxiongensis]AYN38631.1 glutamate--cysteine ligase [Streptomyces dangxiongensis]